MTGHYHLLTALPSTSEVTVRTLSPKFRAITTDGREKAGYTTYYILFVLVSGERAIPVYVWKARVM